MAYRISLIRIDPTLAPVDGMQRALADMELLARVVQRQAFASVAAADRDRFHDIARHRDAAAAALMKHGLRRADVDYDATATRLGIPPDDVRSYEAVLLRSEDIQVEMTGDGATIVVEGSTRDRGRMQRVWACIETLAAHGYNAFDPQMEESITPAFGFERYFERWGA